MKKEELLYRYFSNSLNPEQQMELDALLKNDSEFLEQFTFEKNIQKGILKSKKDVLKNKLKGFEKELKAKDVKPKPNYKIWAIAASIALLVAFTWFNLSTTTANYDTLYAENFQNYPNTVFSITRGDTNNSIERKAFVAYESGDFKNAISYFEKMTLDIEAHSITANDVNFYLALSYMQNEDIEKAKTNFNAIIKSQSNFTAESLWYLSLLLLNEEDKTQAISGLKELLEKHSYNKEKAIQLLEDLD